MADVMELLDHIRREQDNFPAAQKKVAAFVVENYQQIAFLPISALSQRVGVSDNTVIKFCNHLGYEKFTEFKKEFTSYAHSELLIYNKIGGETAPVSEGDNVWSMIQNDAIASLQETLSDPQNHSSLTELLARMEKAKHIYVTGGRLSGIAAAMLANKLRYLNLQVHDLSCGTVGDYIDQTALVHRRIWSSPSASRATPSVSSPRWRICTAAACPSRSSPTRAYRRSTRLPTSSSTARRIPARSCRATRAALR